MKRLFPLTLSIIAVLILPGLALAQTSFSASLNTISPTAEDVTGELPPFPSRLNAFGFVGTTGSTYTITFDVSAEPTLTVAVGADIASYSFDSTTSQLTLSVTYSGASILSPSYVDLPTSSFLVILDPGVTNAQAARFSHLTRKLKRRTLARATQSTASCYGPKTDPDFYANETSDFGDNDGLLDESSGDPVDLTVGLPLSVPGSYASTNTFLWCFIPPTAANPKTGFTLTGAKSARATLGFTASPELVQYLGDRASKSLTPAGTAIFSGDVQVSTAVTDVSGGAQIGLSLLLTDGLTAVEIPTVTQTALGSAGTQKREITLAPREPVSVVPDTTVVSRPSLSIDGVVDPQFEGEIIELIRVDDERHCKAINVSAGINGIVIGRDTIAPGGSWNISVPSSALFPNNAKKTNIVARIVGNVTQQSRQISLTNKNRKNRR